MLNASTENTVENVLIFIDNLFINFILTLKVLIMFIKNTYSRFETKIQGKIKNAVIIYPYLYQNPYYVLPPIGAEYCQAGLESLGINTKLYDMRFEESIDNIYNDIINCDLVCIYGHIEYSPLYGHFEKNIINKIFNIIPESTPIIAGGKGFFEHEQPFEKYKKIDIVTLGSPDIPLQSLFKNQKIDSISNIIYRNLDNHPIKNPREYLDLSENIFPRRDLRNPKYLYHAGSNKLDMIWSGYGCNNRCTFCNEFGKDYDRSPMKYRGRSSQSLYNEIKTVEAGIVAIYDDNITTNMTVLSELSDLLIENKIYKSYVAAGRVSHILKAGLETIKKLERGGFIALSLGMESVKDDTLKLYRKGLNQKMLVNVMKLLNQTNIIVNGTFLLGSPGETESDMDKISEFARKYKLDNISTNRLRIEPGSVLYNLVNDANGQPIENLKRIEGDELARIKYKIKFGQRNPLRITRTFLKLYKNKGLKTDPTYIIINAIELFIKHTWIEKSLVIPLILKIFKFLFKLSITRHLTRLSATLFMPLIDLLLFFGSLINRVKPDKFNILPSIFLILKDNLFEKHRELAQKMK